MAATTIPSRQIEELTMTIRHPSTREATSMTAIRLLAAALLAALLLAATAPARAASAYDSCTGTIPALPATISTQGTWCLSKDLNTAVTTGNAITITANNVTIDCNGFKL